MKYLIKPREMHCGPYRPPRNELGLAAGLTANRITSPMGIDVQLMPGMADRARSADLLCFAVDEAQR